MTQKDANVITATLVFVIVELLVAWVAVSVLNGHIDDTWVLLLIAIFLFICVAFLRVYWAYIRVEVPAGLAGIIYSPKQAIQAVAGPTVLLQIPYFRRVEVVPLEQKTLDLNHPCITRDRIKVNVVVSVFYRIPLDSMVAHLNGWIDIVGNITRYVYAKLTLDMAACDMVNVATIAPRTVSQMANLMNRSVPNINGTTIHQVMVTDIMYPLEVMRSAEAIARAQSDETVAKSKANSRVLELAPEIDARISELQKLEATIKTVSKATLDFVETHTMFDHLDQLPKK